ncbi:hypothetical protein M1N88_03965 [Dehalococcoidia bacterium]|nr:hypothetical protein [Dehalococcoidia bacterium]
MSVLLILTNLEILQDIPEAGMGIFAGKIQLEGAERIVIISSDGIVLPNKSAEYYSLEDLLNGNPIPSERSTVAIQSISDVIESRRGIATALPATTTSSITAVPLVVKGYTLGGRKLFHRFVRGSRDPKFSGGKLVARTYLTTDLDYPYANSGLAAVGRYSLPVAMPPSQRIEYWLPAGTVIDVGTVLPQFGQSGGGVEVQLSQDTSPVDPPKSNPVPEF